LNGSGGDGVCNDEYHVHRKVCISFSFN